MDSLYLMFLNRTIMALWKARSLSPEQKVQIVEEESEVKSLQTEESGSFLGLDDVSMSEVYSSAHSVPVSSLSGLYIYFSFFGYKYLCVLWTCSKCASPLEL